VSSFIVGVQWSLGIRTRFAGTVHQYKTSAVKVRRDAKITSVDHHTVFDDLFFILAADDAFKTFLAGETASQSSTCLYSGLEQKG